MRKQTMDTFVRIRRHSIQAVDALFILFFSFADSGTCIGLPGSAGRSEIAREVTRPRLSMVHRQLIMRSGRRGGGGGINTRN
jgi:hypothetical protein